MYDPEDLAFGQKAIHMGLIFPSDLEKAFLKQKQYAEQEKNLSISKILLHMKCLSPHQVDRIIKSQSPSSCTLDSSPTRVEHQITQTRNLQDLDPVTIQKTPKTLSPQSKKPYPIVKILGKGGYGVVYEVKDPFLERSTALKILLQHKAKLSMKKRFLREILFTSKLDHPNIMPVYEGGYLQDGSLYFMMKKMKSHTLKDVLKPFKNTKKSRISLQQKLEIFLKICDALHYAHSKGIIHRDLKPANIALGNFGEVIVMDWGIAKHIKETDVEIPEEEHLDDSFENASKEELTMAGNIVGTVGYMSPEQASGKKITPRSDIYSLGVILYEILTQNLPFKGNTNEMLSSLLMKEPPSPKKRFPHLNIPPELSAITMKAIGKEPSKRYYSVDALKKDIMSFQEGYSVSAQNDSVLQKIGKFYGRNKVITLTIAMASILVCILLTMWIQTMSQKVKTEKSLASLHKQEKKLQKQLKSRAKSIQKQEKNFQKKKQEFQREIQKQKTILSKQTSRLLKQKNKIAKNDVIKKFNDAFQTANYYKGLGNLYKSIEALKKILYLNHRKNLLLGNIAVYYLSLNNFPKSYEYFKKIVQMKARYPFHWPTFVYLLIKMKKYREARLEIDFFRKKWENHPSYPEICNVECQLFIQKNKLKQAIGSCKKGILAIKKQQLNLGRLLSFYVNLGNIYYSTKNRKQAIFYYQKALKCPYDASQENMRRQVIESLQKLVK